MVLPSLINHNFIDTPPQEFDVLADFPQSSRKLICFETEQVLSARLFEALSPTSPSSSSSKLGAISLPIIFEPQPQCLPILWKLPSWQHLKWTMHALAPVFALNLDSIQSLSNAVKIYCLWLKSPPSRPSCVTPERLEEFISLILYDLTELFVPRSITDGKPNNNNHNLLWKRHIELCQLVLNTFLSDTFLSSDIFDESRNSMWNLLTGIILGLSDNLLWRDTPNYLADDLAEHLLNSCFFILLKSQMYSDGLWRKFSSCFKLWCHRVKSILVWGSVSEALNRRVFDIMHSASSSEETCCEISFGLHQIEFKLIISDKFAIFCWSHLSNFLAHVSSLSADTFLRAIQAIEKLSLTWLLGLDNTHSDANTIFEVYGEYIFEAVLIEKPSHESGRAIAIAALCKILSKRQYRTQITGQNLTFSILCLKRCLSASEIHTVASTLLVIGDVFIANLPGFRCLLLPLFTAIRRIIPKLTSSKFPTISANQECLRMKCYQLLSYIYPFLKEGILTSGRSMFPSLNSTHSQLIFTCYQQQKSSSVDVKVNNSACLWENMKASLMDTLVSSLLVEESTENIQIIIKLITSILYSDGRKYPLLVSAISTIFVESLCKEKFSSSIDVQLLIARALQQISGFGLLDSVHLKKFCLNLTSFALTIHSRLNLTVNFRLLLSIYDLLYDLLISFISLSSTCSSTISTDLSECINQFITILIKFMNTSNSGNLSLNNNTAGGGNKRQSTLNSQRPSSPPGNSLASSSSKREFYGLKCRKSLSERVFSLEVGLEDPRPNSISPTLLKSIDEIFLECTDTTVQRVINLLFNIQCRDPQDLEETGENFKYFALSTSTIIGYFKDVLIVRCPSGKFYWKTAQHHLELDEIENFNAVSKFKESSIIVLDNLMSETDKMSLQGPWKTSDSFSYEVVDDDLENASADTLVNETNWMKTIDMLPITRETELESVLMDAKHHFTKFISEFEKKSQFAQLGPQSTQDSSLHLTRLLLTNMGFLTPATRSLLTPIQWNESLQSDLFRLDSLPNRERFTIPVYFIQQGDSVNFSVSSSFNTFFMRLKNSASTQGSLYLNPSVEVLFKFTTLTLTHPVSDGIESSDGNESVSIIWSEDLHDDFFDKLPQSSNSIVYLVITPISIGTGVKGEYFRVKFLFTRPLLESLSPNVGPIVDGMIVEKDPLSFLIRDTAITAHLFISHQLQNCPSPIMQRQHLLKSIVFKNYTNPSFGALIETFL